jgi:transposase-like protein/IS1 family transposase
MKPQAESQMDVSRVFCPNLECPARGKMGQGNIVIHSQKRPRYRCTICKKTFSAREGTMFAGLRKPEALIVQVVTLLAYGCPPQAIVHAFQLDERTVARWQERAGAHCHKVHEDQVVQAKLDLVHVQADEIRVKGCKMIPWMALALMVSTRLWLGGVISLRRDRHLADRLLEMVKACCQPLVAVLVQTDGWAAYPNSIRRAFREKVKGVGGRGRSRLQAWPDIVIGTVIKKTVKKRVVEVIRRVTQGGAEAAMALLAASGGGTQLNTAFIERLNATFRERLASLTRRCRHTARKVFRLEAGMWLVGCTYNFCWPHHELSRRAAKSQDRRGMVLLTPAMASGLTEHVWSVRELLTFRVPPPAWVAPKRRGRPPTVPPASKVSRAARPLHLRPLLRLRKGALCPSTR